jgi:hypothetical protein
MGIVKDKESEMHPRDFQYTVDGFSYHAIEDREDDNIKLFHECYRDGRRVVMPAAFYNESPYRLITPAKFREYCRTVEVFIQSKVVDNTEV